MLLAALVGALVETIGLAPMFAGPDERPRATLIRVKPRAVLLDCAHDDACGEAFLGPATMMGASVLLFGSRRAKAHLSSVAARHALQFVVLPISATALAEHLRKALKGDVQ